MDSPEILFCTAEGCESPRAEQDAKASNRHCPAHRAEAQRKYNASRLDQQQGKGYVKGVDDLREILVTEFATRIAGSSISGYDAAYLIRNAPGPQARDISGSEKPKDQEKEPVKA